MKKPSEFSDGLKSISWFSVRNGIGRHIQLPYLHLPNKPNGVPDQSFATISPIYGDEVVRVSRFPSDGWL